MELPRIKSFHPDQMGPFFLGGNLPGETAGPARVPAIVIAGTHQGPASMGLAFDVGGGSIVLRVQRVELLVEAMVGRDPRINRAADGLDRRCLHDPVPIVDPSSLSRRPTKRGPVHLVPLVARTTLER